MKLKLIPLLLLAGAPIFAQNYNRSFADRGFGDRFSDRQDLRQDSRQRDRLLADIERDRFQLSQARARHDRFAEKQLKRDLARDQHALKALEADMRRDRRDLRHDSWR